MDRFTFTTAGLEYAAKTSTGSVLNFTNGKYGNGKPPADTASLTDLVNPLGELSITSRVVDGNTVTVRTSFNNIVGGKILPAFHLTEMGIFAKLLSSDGVEEKPETLVGYACISGDDVGDYISGAPTEFIINWPFSISNADNVTVSVNLETYALKMELEEKLDKTQYASINQAGIIKLHSGGGTNRSGIVVNEKDGTAYISTQAERGTNRSGAGVISVSAATEAEIDEGVQEYKPIVPKTLKHAVESITKNNGYSKTPVQIGTWIDGTPVWRAVFHHEFTQSDIETIEEYGDFTIPRYYENGSYFFILGYGAEVHVNNTPCVLDDATCTNLGNGGIGFTTDIVSSIVNGRFTGMHGWVEFVTPESNLKEGEI